MKSMIFSAVAGVMALALNAKTLYVDAANYGKSGLDGTEALAYGTIQDAIDAAAKDDTIKVRPGVYDQGGKPLAGFDYTLVHRVMINKKLTIESTDGRDVTHIVGYKDPDGDEDGRGLNAIRCIGVAQAGLGSTMTGFTVRDSACFAGTSDSSLTNLAGGVYISGANENFTMTACAISNCVAYAGGGVRGGRYFRCLITDNKAKINGSAAITAKLVNCMITRQRELASTLHNGCVAINCTLAGNRSSGFSDTQFYNCILNCNAAGGSEAAANLHASVSVVLGDDVVQLAGPSIGDYRTLSTSAAVGRGETRYLSADAPFAFPAGADLRDFDGNEIDLAAANCNAGAFQTTVTPRYGGIYIDSKAKVNGLEMHGPNYFFADTWPMQVKVEPILENGKVFHRYMLANGILSQYPPLADRGARSRFLQEDGCIYLAPPFFAGEVMTNQAVYVTRTLYVDASRYGEEGLDGSTASPYGTIQDALDKCTDQNARYLILVRPGDYNAGGAVANGVFTRVVIPNARYILIKSTDGAAVTTIRGAADTSSPRDAANYPGLGPNAVRCVAVMGSAGAVALQGFTLADGHTDAANPGSTKIVPGDTCGGFYGPATDGARAASQILDCVITNCSGVAGGALIYAWASRCRVVDCHGVSDATRFAFLSSCLVADCGATALGSTVYTVNCAAPDATLRESSWHYNSLFGDQKTIPASSQYFGSLIRSGKVSSATAVGHTFADPGFADPAADDWRVLNISAAIDTAQRVFPDEDAATWGKFATNFAQFVTSDLKGRPWLMGGKYPVAGVLQEVAPGMAIADPQGVLSIDGAAVGTNALVAGATVTVGRVANPSRNVQGVIVNGATNLWSELPGGVWSYVVPEASIAAGPMLTPYIVPDWYVNPLGNDANDGCSAATPKRTLAAALGMAVSGDTVHAAPGVYNEGTMPPPPNSVCKFYSPSRAVIYSGISLVSDEGAARTFIEGAAGTDEWTNELGCGSNAVRCVLMDENALVKGFTLRGGRTNPGSKASEADHCGAGAAGFTSGSRHYARVEDCVITECKAHNGAAARYVALFNTTVTNNYATLGVTSECDFYGATINGNYAGGSSVYQFTLVYDSTIGPDAWDLNGGPGIALSEGSSTNVPTLVNTLVLGKCSTAKMMVAPSNCAFVVENVTGKILSNVVDTIATNAAALAVDAELRPVAGVNVACDRANPELLPAAHPSIWPYIRAQRARLTNGALDIGAKEADWRAVYARDIGGRTMTVVEATSNVVESAAHTVYINPGESLAATWAGKPGGSARFTLPVRVTGGGTLTVTINGETRSFTAGEATWNFVSALAENSVAFSYEGDGQAEVLNGGRLTGLALSFR